MLKRITTSLISKVLSSIVSYLRMNPKYLTYSAPKLTAIMLSKLLRTKIRILVTGARDWKDKAFMRRVLKQYDAKNCILIHGNCKGADQIAGEVATELGMEVEVYPAEWKRYRFRAGPIRNVEMLKTNPSIILVWHDHLAESRGTKSCVQSAIKMKYASRLEYFSHSA